MAKYHGPSDPCSPCRDKTELLYVLGAYFRALFATDARSAGEHRKAPA